MDRDLEREAWDKARLSLSLSLSLLLDGILKRGAGCRIDHTFAKIEIKRPPLFRSRILVANSSSVHNRKLLEGTIRETLSREWIRFESRRSNQLIPPNKSRS